MRFSNYMGCFKMTLKIGFEMAFSYLWRYIQKPAARAPSASMLSGCQRG